VSRLAAVSTRLRSKTQTIASLVVPVRHGAAGTKERKRARAKKKRLAATSFWFYPAGSHVRRAQHPATADYSMDERRMTIDMRASPAEGRQRTWAGILAAAVRPVALPG